MALATARCKCAECGTEFTKSTKKGNRQEANSWEEWAQANFTQCSSCWAKEQRRKEAETPLTLVIDCDPYEQTVVLHFEGNTLPVKEEIKALGFWWDKMPAVGMFGLLDTRTPIKRWWIAVDLEDVKGKVNQVKSLNPVVKNNITNADMAAFSHIKQQQEEKDKLKQDEICAIAKPVVPAKLRGKTWNQTVYGMKGAKCFYSEGVKISLTDEEADEFDCYLEKKAVYQKAIAEIEAKYR